MSAASQIVAPSLSSGAELEFFEAFVGDLIRRGRRPKTVECYRSDRVGICEFFLETQGEAFSLDALTQDSVPEFKRWLMARGMTPATINRKLVFVKRYVDFGRAHGHLDEQLARSVRRVQPVPAPPRQPRVLSDLELRRFLNEVEARAPTRDRAMILTLLETGLKVSELVSLRREQVGLGARAGLIRLDADVRGRARRVSVGPAARRALRTWLDERGEHDGALWEGERGPLTANAVQRLMRKYCDFAGVCVSPQVLRHTFAHEFLSNSRGDLIGLADALGHLCLETTRLYLTGKSEARGAEPLRAGGARG